MSMTATLKEQLALPALSGGIVPISQAAEINSGTIDMTQVGRAMFILSLGLGNATGNCKLQYTNNANGATATNISGTAVAYTTNSSIITMEVRQDQLGGVRYVKANVIPDGAVLLSVVGLGAELRFKPSTIDNATTNSAYRVVANV